MLVSTAVRSIVIGSTGISIAGSSIGSGESGAALFGRGLTGPMTTSAFAVG